MAYLVGNSISCRHARVLNDRARFTRRADLVFFRETEGVATRVVQRAQVFLRDEDGRIPVFFVQRIVIVLIVLPPTELI